MLDSLTARIAAVALSIIIAMLIFIAPRSVSSNKEFKLTAQQARLELGRAYVEGGGPPMKGIKLLQKVLEDDPKNHFVRWYLASQALNTGQFRKAINHLKLLEPVFSGKEKANVLSALGVAHHRSGNLDSARLYYQKVFDITKDSLLLQSLKLEN